MDIFIALAAQDPNLPYLGTCPHGGDPDWGQAALRRREDGPGKRDGSQICQSRDRPRLSWQDALPGTLNLIKGQEGKFINGGGQKLLLKGHNVIWTPEDNFTVW